MLGLDFLFWGFFFLEDRGSVGWCVKRRWWKVYCGEGSVKMEDGRDGEGRAKGGTLCWEGYGFLRGAKKNSRPERDDICLDAREERGNEKDQSIRPFFYTC